jgi:hypothetical protein
LRQRAAGIEPASAGDFREFGEHCSPPEIRHSPASECLSDSLTRGKSLRDFLPSASPALPQIADGDLTSKKTFTAAQITSFNSIQIPLRRVRQRHALNRDIEKDAITH